MKTSAVKELFQAFFQNFIQSMIAGKIKLLSLQLLS